ncbi:imidazole glycerol phosphate synthase subunit HisH [Dermacoccaceae bacterium W4C1]
MSAARRARVVVLDYGSGNVRSVVRMLEHVGASVELTADPAKVLSADGLYMPGVGNFHACMAGLRQVDGPRLLSQRIADGAPVLGVCVGLQVLFEGSSEPTQGEPEPGTGLVGGRVERLPAPVVPHMGWSLVRVDPRSQLLSQVADERFYFVHSYAVLTTPVAPESADDRQQPVTSWSRHGSDFVAALEHGPLAATQFHPEKSGEAGAGVLRAWLQGL